MNWITSTSLMLGIVLLNSGLFIALPALSRRDILFAVTVPDAFRFTDVARRVVQRYRLTILVGTLLTLAGVVIGTPIAPVLVAEVGVVWFAWARAHAAITPYTVGPPSIRVATLTARESGIPGGWLIFLPPFLILGAAALFLSLSWDRIPDRFPTHWSGDGTPNRWTTKSATSVYGPLAFGLPMLIVCTFMTSSLVTRTRQIAAMGQAARAERRFKRGNVLASLVSCYLMAGLFSFFAVRPVLSARDELGLTFWLVIGPIAVLSTGMMIWMVRSGQGGQRALAPAERALVTGDATPDEAWKLGLVYYNPSDPALLVEKRMGLGWTLNYGNKLSWLITAAALSPLVWVLWVRLSR